MKNLKKTALGILGGGVADTTAPTVTIACGQTGPTAISPLTYTFTLSEVSIDFAIGDLTVGNGVAGNFAGSGTSYTCTVTPTASGPVTMDIAADTFHDAAGNGNTAATQHSIVAVVYTLCDEFVTNATAPLTSPRTCEPGPGTLTIADTGNNMSIASNAIAVAANAGTQNPSVTTPTIAKAIGLMSSFKSLGAASTRWAVDYFNEQLAYSNGMASPAVTGDTLAQNDFFSVVQFSARRAYMFGTKIVWVGITALPATGATQRGGYTAGGTPCGFDSLHVVKLPAPWTTDNGIATSAIASPTNGQTSTSEANMWMEFTWTVATGETLIIMFRRTDDDNTMKLVCTQADGTIKLYERSGGVDTEKDAGKTQTWTNATAYRIVIVTEGTAVKTYVANAVKHNTTSTLNNSVTGLKVSGFATGANLIAWPRTLSGMAATVLGVATAANPNL